MRSIASYFGQQGQRALQEAHAGAAAVANAAASSVLGKRSSRAVASASEDKKEDAADSESLSPEDRSRIEENRRRAEEKLAAKRARLMQEDHKDAGEERGYEDLHDLLDGSWKERLAGEFGKIYFRTLTEFLSSESRKGIKIFPPKPLIFNAFALCPLDEVRVVILGQDPYHDVGQAEGLAFSVPRGIPAPSSLRNVYKELASDVGFVPPRHGNLSAWARQGVLLLNTSLTVEAHKAASHSRKGWTNFTDTVIDVVNRYCDHVVFMLWGRHAQEKAKRIDKTKHLVLTSAHPSGLSANKGFFGCRHFSKANEFLRSKGKDPIDWQLPL